MGLPDVVREAFSADAAEPLKLGDADLKFFKANASKRTPPPVARYLRLLRRLRVLKAPYGSGVGDLLVATVDLSQLPAKWEAVKDAATQGPLVPLLMMDMVDELLKSMAIRNRSYFLSSGFMSFSVRASDAKKLAAVEAQHQAFIGDGPLFLGEVSGAWSIWAPSMVENLDKALAKHTKLTKRR
jgi:hypothetical protein